MNGVWAILQDHVVVNIVVASDAPAPGAVEITALDPRPGIGWAHQDGAWVPPAPRPEIVLTSLVGSEAAHVDLPNREVTTPAGSPIQSTGELRIGGVKFAAFSGVFRLPIRATDGRERIVLATISAGDLTATFPCRESGIWEVSEALINRELPEDKQMTFQGLRVFVLEV